MRCKATALVALSALFFFGRIARTQTSFIYTITSASPASVTSGSGDTVITITGVQRVSQYKYNVCFYNGTTSDTIVPTAYNFNNPAAVTYTFTVPGARFQTGTSAATNSIYIVNGGASVPNGCTGADAGISNTFSYATTASNYSLRTASPSTLPSGSNTSTVTISGTTPTFPTNGSGLGLCFYAGVNNAPLLPTSQSGTSSIFSVPAATFSNAGTAKIYLATASATCTGSNTAYSNVLSFVVSQAQRFNFTGYFPNPLPAGSGNTTVTLSGNVVGSTVPSAATVCFFTGANSSTITPTSITSSQVVFTAPSGSFQIPNATFPSGTYTAYAYLAPAGSQCAGPGQNPGLSNSLSITLSYPSIASSKLQVVPQVNTAVSYTALPRNLELFGSDFVPSLTSLINLGGGRTSLAQSATSISSSAAVVPLPTLDPSTQPLASVSVCNRNGSFQYCSPGFPLTAYPLAASGTAVSSSNPSPAPSQPVTLTATITPGAGSQTAGGSFVPGPPTGTVAFSDGQNSLGSSPLVAGTLQFKPVSTQEIAIFAGAGASPGQFTPSAAKGSETVRPNETPSPNVNSQFSSIIADFNQDGINDTLLIQSATGVLHLFFGGSPLGTIQSEQTIYPGNSYCTSLSGVTVADLNNDGFPDIAFLCGDSGGEGSLLVSLNAGDGTFPNYATNLGVVIGNQLAAADINGDGKIDLVLTGNTGTFCCTGQTFGIQTFLGDGTGHFSTGPVTTTTDVPGTQIVLKDLNNDGAADLALLHYDATAGKTEVALFQNDGTGRFTRLTPLPICNCQLTNSKLFVTPFGASNIYPGIVVDYQEGASILAFTNKGTSAIAFNSVPPAAFSNLADVVLGDFNGDGLVDMAYYDGSSISVASGNGAGAFTPNASFAPYLPGTGSANAVSIATAQDLNGDGYADLLAIYPSATSETSTIASYVTTGTAVASVPTQFTTAGSHSIGTVYKGNINMLGSNGAQTINVVATTVAPTLLTFAPPSTVAATSATQPYVPNGTFALNFQVNQAASDSRTPTAPTGTVTVSDASGVLASGSLSALSSTSSSASIPSFGSATIGTHTYNVSYNGNSFFSPASQTFTFTVTKAAPAITWTPASTTNTTTALGANILNATASVPGTFAYTPASGYLGAGTQTITAIFTPTDATDYAPVTTTRNVTVAKTTPMITGSATPAPHPYTPNLPVYYTTTITGTNIQPTGTVQFLTNSSPTNPPASVASAGPATVSSTINYSSLPAGTFAFSGTYSGDSVYNAVTSTPTSYTISQATPNVTATLNPPPIVFGTPISASLFNATADVPGSFAYNPALGTTLPAGADNVIITFTPTDTTDYSSITKNATATVTKATPNITFVPNPATLVQGQPLGTAQLDATADVSGAFVYSPTLGTVLPAGPNTITATFTPADTTDYTSVTKSATVTVTTKQNPVISFVPNPATVTYGTPLSAAQLDAVETSGLPGVFTYNPALNAVLPVGPNTITATFVPTDTVDYNTVIQAATVTVTRAAATITWNPAAATNTTTPLGSTILNATPSVPGTFAYTPAAASYLAAGTQTITAVFTPTDAANYSGVTTTRNVVVSKTTPTLFTNVSPASPTTYSPSLSIAYAAIVAGTNIVPTGQIQFRNNGAAIDAPATLGQTAPATSSASSAISLATGTASLTASYAGDAVYNALTSVATNYVVNQATPTVIFNPNPATLVQGQPLTAAQLDATASVPGTFSYNPALGTVLPNGPNTVAATFTPTDATNYSTIVKTAVVTVTSKQIPVISFSPNPSSISYGTPLSVAQLDAYEISNLPGVFTYNPGVNTVLPFGPNTITATFTPTDLVNYAIATQTAVVTVTQAIPVISFAPNPSTIPYGTRLSAAQLNATSSVSGAFSYSPALGALLNAGVTTLTATFTPTDTTIYKIVTQTAALTVTPFTPTITWAAPATIPFGTPLSSAQLNAIAKDISGVAVPGTYSYSPAAAAVLPLGVTQDTVTFTPTTIQNFNVATTTVPITVGAVPTTTILAVSPSSVAVGQAVTLTASVTPTIGSGPAKGQVAFSDSNGTITPAQATLANGVASVTYTPATQGTHLLTATFQGSTDYLSSATLTPTSLAVGQGTPVITFTPSPATIVYGTPLSSSQLDAVQSTSIGGVFSYSSAIGTILKAGVNTITATFTPTDTVNFATVTKTANVTVTRAVPTLSWPTPQTINQGTPLSSTQLNAAASGIDSLALPGTFTYTPAAGTILPTGTQTLTVLFTPADAIDYASASATVNLSVINPAATTVLTTSLTPSQFGQPITLTATISTIARAGTPLTGNVTFFDGPTQLGLPVPITLTSAGAVATLPVATLGTGNHQLTAAYGNDPNYVAGNSLPLAQTITVAPTTLIWAPALATIPYGTPLSAAQLNAIPISPYLNNIAGLVTYTPAAGTVLPAGPQTLTATFIPADTTNFLPAAASALITVTQVLPTIVWPTPEPIAQGTPLSANQLNATASVPGVFAYTPSAGTILQAGTTTLRALFTPTDAVDYTTAATNVPLVVSIPATTTTLTSSLNPSQSGQAITLTATVVQQGTSTQPVTGMVTFTEGTRILGTSALIGSTAALTTSSLSVSNHVIGAAYGGSADFANSASLPLIQTVTSAATQIVWTPNPSTIVYGTPLSPAQLNATAMSASGTTVFGTFTYMPATGSVLPAGSQTLTVAFTPSDSVASAPATATVAITITRATPTLAWAAPTAVPIGTRLSSAQLNATATGVGGVPLAGTFAYSPAAETLVTPGPQTLSVLFTPTDTADYTTVSTSVTLNGTAVTLVALSSSTAFLGDPDRTITLTGTGFVQNSVARANGASLTTSYVNPTTLTAILPASRFLTVQTLQITVNDPTQNQTTAALPFTVTPPQATPRISAPSTASTGDQPPIQFALATPYPVDIAGTFTLSFIPVSGAVVDPATQFASGGTSFVAAIPAGTTTIPNLLIQTGSVAGTIQVNLKLTLAATGADITPASLAPLIINVPPVVPGITSVAILRSGRQLTVRTTGLSNPREVARATFHFTPAAGQTVATPDVTIDVGSIFSGWYSQSASTAYGSTFLYTQTFSLDDDASVVDQVSVTLSNAIGVSPPGSSQQ